MSNTKIFISFIIIINLISFILCQFESESMTKAIACMTVINQKLKGEDPEQTIYSSMMLKCFVTITSSQAKKILVGLESGGGSLSQKDIKKLTDYNSLRDMSQKELEKKFNDLERALKKFKKMQEELTGGSGNRDPSDYDDDDYYDEDDNFNSETPKNINLFGLIPRIIFGIFSVFNNYLMILKEK